MRFTVLGKAEPAGSKKAFVIKGTNRAIVTDANAKAKPWQAEVRAAAMEANPYGHLLEGPLVLRVDFYMPRPKSVKREYPTVKPDATKLLRGVEDAMTGIVYRDDAQIVEQHIYKNYGEPARAEISVERLSLERKEGVSDRRAVGT